jgi:hypothetical protein
LTNRLSVRNFAVVNLALVSLCIISYVATLYLLTFWTYWRWSQGELGGVLDYKWFGISVVYHVTQVNLETVFLLPDFTPYLLIGFIVFNLVALFLGQGFNTPGQRIRIRIFAILNTIIAILSVVAYVWTMMFIDSTLRIMFSITQRTSGFVQYQFPIAIWNINAFQGYQEASIMRTRFDFTVWLLFILLILAVKLLRCKPKQ